MIRKIDVLPFLLCVMVTACGSARKPDPSAAGAFVPPSADEEQPEPAMTLAWLAEDAILLDGLGHHHREVTTASSTAQAYFDQGLRLLYGFNHDEAARSFARAAAIDPTCAMCFWGAAITLGPNYNVPMLSDRSAMAWEGLQKARANAHRGTAVEQALILALAKRHAGPEPMSPEAMRPYNELYAAAMRAVARQFPEDMDIQVLFAEALMNIEPWRLWSIEGVPAPRTPEIVSTLEGVLALAPDHPGANHYYIHAVEASPHPEKALRSADRLAGLMPGAGHMVHMPAHIYQRIGRYADASDHNRKAAEADLAYMGRVKPWGYYSMYLAHNYGFLAYSASMEGRSEESLRTARIAAKVFPTSMLEMMPGMDFFVAEPLLAMVRFGKYDELLAEPQPDRDQPVLTALWLHGRGMALAAKGRLDEALEHHTRLSKLAASVSPELRAGNNAARDVMDVAASVLLARIAEKRGKPDALAQWAAAVAKADRLAYSEPADWFYPVRHYLGAALLTAGKHAKAEAVYREDLARNPENGWSLFGLTRALAGQKKTKEAAATEARFRKAWARADIELTTTAF
jgi:tetratricopeptide (TPR) repeat protein